MAGLRQYGPFFLRGLLGSFVGTQGTRIPNGLADGSLVYLSFVLAKPGGRHSIAVKKSRSEIQHVSAMV
jgi:hypothetical protein